MSEFKATVNGVTYSDEVVKEATQVYLMCEAVGRPDSWENCLKSCNKPAEPEKPLSPEADARARKWAEDMKAKLQAENKERGTEIQSQPVPEPKEVKVDPEGWKKYWNTTPAYHTNSPSLVKFESPEIFRVPISKSIPVTSGVGSVEIDGENWVAYMGCIIPEHQKDLIDFCKSIRLFDNGFKLIIGKANKNLFDSTSLFNKHGDVKAEGWSFQHQMLYGQNFNFNTHPKERITRAVLPHMLWCYLEITDYTKASTYLQNNTSIPCVVIENMSRYNEDYKIRQVVDKANKYVIYWQLYNKPYTTVSTNSYSDMLLDNIE